MICKHNYIACDGSKPIWAEKIERPISSAWFPIYANFSTANFVAISSTVLDDASAADVVDGAVVGGLAVQRPV